MLKRFALWILPLFVAPAALSAEPVTAVPWREAVVSVTDLDRSAAFFTAIGGYRELWRGPVDAGELRLFGLGEGASGEALLLGPEGATAGLVRLVRFDDAGPKVPMRPGSRPWDTGCYFSLMVRIKDMPAFYADAIRLG